MPPKKRKEAPRNGFYYFMLEFKNAQRKQYKNMQEIACEANPHWTKMSKEEKKPYEEKAMFERNNVRCVKYTSDGIEIDEIERIQQEEKENFKKMRENISKELKLAGKNGSPLPLGYAAEAQMLSKETHQIPPPQCDAQENNEEEVFRKMIQFLQRRAQGSKNMPTLYCLESHMQMVLQILNTWCERYDNSISLEVYNLQYMFRVLKNTAAGSEVWESDTISIREIEKDVNAFAKNISCEYHEYSNVPIYCSRSVVVRYAYTICDNCCTYLNIPFVPGCHLPHQVTMALSRPSSVASVRSSKSSSSKNYSSTEDDAQSLISVSSKSEWDNRSVASDISTITDEDEDFPSLGKNKKYMNSSPRSWRFLPNDSSSICSQSSVRSYAGATGTAGLSRRPADFPSSLRNRMDKLSVDSSASNASIFSMSRGTTPDFRATEDFPSLSHRGRGLSRGRGGRRGGTME